MYNYASADLMQLQPIEWSMKIDSFLEAIKELSGEGSEGSVQFEDYSVVNVGSHAYPDIVGLKVHKYGRMGNNFLQIINAVHLASILNLKYVWAPQLQLSAGMKAVKWGGIEIFSSESTPPEGGFVAGTFFHLPIARELRPSNATRRELALECILPLLDVDEKSYARNENELVVHLRSGDIFSQSPHPNYVQPPLAYYTKIISGGINSKSLNHVHIVAEDDANPCVDALKDWLEGRSVSFSYQSSSLKSDVGRLRAARNVVYGTGTFGFGISLISMPIDRMFLFGHTGWYGNLPHIGKATIYCAGADYIEPGSWKNSAEQRRLMIEYPEEGITEVRRG